MSAPEGPLAGGYRDRTPFRIAAISLTLLGLAAAPARAAPPELLSALALHPSDPDHLVLAYVQGGQGLLFSADGGHSFALRCGAAVSASFTRSRAPLFLTLDGETLLGTFEGLVRGGADGCGFRDDAALSGLQVADIAAHPLDPALSFLVTANAADERWTGLLRRNADGSFTELGGADARAAASVAMNRLRVVASPGGGLRFYASALRALGPDEYVPVIRVSDDAGATWRESTVTGAEGARLQLIAADPTNPDRIAVALQRDALEDTVLISSDAGQTFEPRLELFELGASAVAPDGRLWLGDAGGDTEYSQPGALYLLDDFGAAPRELARYPVRCLGYRALDERLLVCQRSEFGSADPATGAFSRRASFETVAGFVACGGEPLDAICEPQLCENWCGVLHYASAPVCDAYFEDSPPCGPPARGYGQSTAPIGPGGLEDDAAAALDEASGDDASDAAPTPVTPEPRACHLGVAPASALASLVLAGLCPMLAFVLRRKQT